jgi:hypothetical protein
MRLGKALAEKRELIPTEDQEQTLLFKRADYYPLIRDHMSAIPNGGLRNKVIAMKLKAQGVRKGVSDIFFAYPFGGYAGLWIEMKRKNATPSCITDEQKTWLRRMINAGYMARVARGADEAWQIIHDYLDGKCEYDEWYSFKSKNMMIANGEGKQ